MFRYRLHSRTGEDLGTVELAISRLVPGKTFRSHGNQQFEIVDVVQLEEDGPIQAMLTVQPAADGQQPWRQ